MKHTFFEIRNFKGIKRIRLEFDKKPSGNVYTLVGLNESGKTTILEAMHFFESKTLKVDALGLHGYSIGDLRQLNSNI
jgi:predicted ATP-dependent endonuclease of OLD family